MMYSVLKDDQIKKIKSALHVWFKRPETQVLLPVKKGYPLTGFESVRSYFLRWANGDGGYAALPYERRALLDSCHWNSNKNYNQDLSNLISEEYRASFVNGQYVVNDINSNSVSKKEGNVNMGNNSNHSGSNSVVNGVSCTKDALLASAQEGLKLAAAQKASRELTSAVRSLAGNAYPVAFFDSPTGHVLECLLMPVVLHALTQVVDVPSGDTIRRACELAMTAEVKDKLSGVLDALVPTLSELGKRLETVKV